MASFWKSINNKYGVSSYKETKDTHDWILKSLEKGNFPNLEVETGFMFDISAITCSCNGIDEFIEYAYGQDEYKFFYLDMRFSSDGQYIASINITSSDELRISAHSKVILEQVIGLIENTTLDESENSPASSVTYVNAKVNNSGVIVNNSSNFTAHNESEIELTAESKETGFKKFWTGVIQNLATNFIWYLLTLIAGFMVAYFCT